MASKNAAWSGGELDERRAASGSPPSGGRARSRGAARRGCPGRPPCTSRRPTAAGASGRSARRSRRPIPRVNATGPAGARPRHDVVADPQLVRIGAQRAQVGALTSRSAVAGTRRLEPARRRRRPRTGSPTALHARPGPSDRVATCRPGPGPRGASARTSPGAIPRTAAFASIVEPSRSQRSARRREQPRVGARVAAIAVDGPPHRGQRLEDGPRARRDPVPVAEPGEGPPADRSSRRRPRPQPAASP